MNKNIGILGGVILIAGVGYFAFTQGKTETVCADEICKIDPAAEQVVSNEAESSLIQEENIGTVEPTEKTSESEASETMSGSFETYSAEIVAEAEGDIIIFFHATWCPSCRALINDIESNMSAIPAGTTILKADYDTETELKKKYGVTTQHTLVQIDKDGTLIKKWSGGSKLANLLSEIQ